MPVVTVTPECDRLATVRPMSQAISGFLEWLDEETPLVICEQYTVRHSEFREEVKAYVPVDINIDRLIAQYFKIDLKLVEEEKDGLLAAIREFQERTKEDGQEV